MRTVADGNGGVNEGGKRRPGGHTGRRVRSGRARGRRQSSGRGSPIANAAGPPPENKYAQESGVETEKLERVAIKLFETPRFVHRGLSGNEISSATGGQAFSGKGQRVSVFSFAVGKETHVAPSEKRKGSSESWSFARRCVVFPGKGFHGWIVSLVKCGRVFLGLLVFKCPGGF